MIVELLAPDNYTLERMIAGCRHYGLKFKHNRRTKSYVHVEVNNEEDVVNIFWLGANLSQPKIKTALTESIY